MADSQVEDLGDASIVRANVNRIVTIAPTFSSYYSNDTQLQTTPWDVRFIFGLIAELDAKNGQVRVEQVAEVRMSPQHAKRIVALLQQQLQTYEAKIGAIPLPPEA